MAIDSDQPTSFRPTDVLILSDFELASILSVEELNQVDEFLRRIVSLYFFRQPERAIALIDGFVKFANDPVVCSLAFAPFDDEPLSDEELEALREIEEQSKIRRPYSSSATSGS